MSDAEVWRCEAKRSHGLCLSFNHIDETYCGACGTVRLAAVVEPPRETPQRCINCRREAGEHPISVQRDGSTILCDYPVFQQNDADVVDETWFACMTGDCDHTTQAQCNARMRSDLIETTQENVTLRSALSAAQRPERERFEAQGWNLGSIEEACAELERLCAQTREAEVRRLAAESAESAAQRDSEAHKHIFAWLLGESGEFPESLPGKRYAFRSELRERLAALSGGSTPRTTEP